jgi:hypothetical protein
MKALFGEDTGVGVRSAVGMGSIPFNIPVEMETTWVLHERSNELSSPYQQLLRTIKTASRIDILFDEHSNVISAQSGTRRLVVRSSLPTVWNEAFGSKIISAQSGMRRSVRSESAIIPSLRIEAGWSAVYVWCWVPFQVCIFERTEKDTKSTALLVLF